MNMRAAIRNVLLAHGSPMRPCEVAKALPQYDPIRVSEAMVGGMYRDGILSRVIREDGYRGYYASRNVKLKKYDTEEARREGKRLTDAAFHKRNSARKKAERAALRPLRMAALNEKRRQLAEARAAEREAAKLARKLERQQQRVAERARLAEDRKAARAAKPKPAKKPMTTAQRVFTQTPAAMKSWPSVTLPPPPAKPRAETVEEFLARGGKIQREPAAWEREQLAA